MSNELLWLGFLILDLSVSLVFVFFFGKQGLFFLIVMNIILCTIQVLKTVELFGLTATLGNILYGGIFFSTDILSEVYGKKEARKGVILGFAALILTTLYMQISLAFHPAPSDFAHPHFQALFQILPRVALGSITAYILSQFHDIWAFQFWKTITKGKHLWLRNNCSTIVSQLIDTTIFCSIAFAGIFEWPVFWEIFMTTFLLKVIVAVLDTPFLYLGRKFARMHIQTQSNANTQSNS